MAANGRFGRTLPSRKWIDRMPRILPSGTGMLPPSSIQETSAFADLVEPASPLAVDAIEQELEEGVDYAPKGPLLRGGICYPFSFTIPHLNLKLSRLSWSTDRQPISFMSRSISSEIFKRPLNAGLTRGRQSIQIKPPSRTCLRAHGKSFQDVGATGDAAVANYIYSVADSIDDLGELVKGAPRTVQLSPP